MTSKLPGQKSNESFIKIQDLIALSISKWYWFAISIFLALAIAFLYIQIKAPTYTRMASILIKDDSKGKSVTNDVNAFVDLGIFQTNTNVNNEIISLKSPATMMEVVKRLRLEVNYTTDGTFRKSSLYGENLPIEIRFDESAEKEFTSFYIKLLPNRRVELFDFEKEDKQIDHTPVTGNLSDSITTPLGIIRIIPTPNFDLAYTDKPILVTSSSIYKATSEYTDKVIVALNDEKSTVINLSISDVSIQRAEDLLNTLISVYNENWVKDKNRIAVSTSMFINERLKVIESELGHVDEDISAYKSRNLLPDVRTASNLYMAQSSEINSQILALNNQLYMARYIRNYLDDSASKTQLLPANTGIESTNIEKQIGEYNTLQLRRNNLVANSSETNPLIVDLDQSLSAMRQAIIVSIDNLVVTLNTQIKNLEQTEEQTTKRIAANPSQAKYLLSVERQQKVKEALYLYLLQKREENELSQAFTAHNTRTITPPYGELKPTAPVNSHVLIIAFLIGLFIPVVIIFIKENMDSTIRNRKDLETLTVPFIGEIPIAQRKKISLPHKKEEESYTVTVKEKSRNIINEAFRVVRTNLEFMLGKEEEHKVIISTSVNPGSGKTFIIINLAASFAIKGKKVLVIDLDMRRATLSKYINSPETGISDYLNGQVKQLSDIIVKNQLQNNLDIIPVGTIPPNPTELLFEKRLEQLLSELKPRYDYIFIDCPPIEIVADTTIIGKLADFTIFIVRAGLLDRSLVPDIEKLYREQKYTPKMALILNGTNGIYAQRGYNRYGYQYGYNYGYGKYFDN